MSNYKNPAWWTSANDCSQKFPYLARQIHGPVSGCFGFGIDYVYEKDKPFIDWLSEFSIDNLSGEWLDRLGIVIGLPRPWATIPLPQDSFQFDSDIGVLDGKKHGFSTDVDFTDPNTGDSYVTTEGGLLYDVHMNLGSQKVSDAVYREYLKAAGLCKKSHSILSIANVVELFVKSYRYAIEFRNDVPGDINVRLSGTLADYEDALQTAFDSMFTTCPKVDVIVDAYFERDYIQPKIQQIADDITGDNLTVVSYFYRDQTVYFMVELDAADAAYQSDVQAALDEAFGYMEGLVITVNIGEPEFQFDFPKRALDGQKHGLSTDVNMTVDGQQVTTNDGGYLITDN